MTSPSDNKNDANDVTPSDSGGTSLIKDSGLIEDFPEDHRCGFVALVGKPNVGKSTLLNALIGEQISIVTPKPQTTRTRIHGILSGSDYQAVFADTPGICTESSPLHKMMRRVGMATASASELVLVMVTLEGETPSIPKEARVLVDIATQSGAKAILVINKIDRVRPKQRLLPWIDLYATEFTPIEVIPISAKKKEGLDILMDRIRANLPLSPPLFPREMHTDRAERFLCEELIRQQLLMRLQQEVPHACGVALDEFIDRRDTDKGCKLMGRIMVERDSQKGIIVGKRGSQIRAISEGARKHIEELLGCQVYLRLEVRVDPHWTRNSARFEQYGIDGGSQLGL